MPNRCAGGHAVRHSWTWKALERARHFGKLFATQLDEHREKPIVSMMQLARPPHARKRIIDIFSRCMTKIDKRKEVQSLKTELKALDLEDRRIAKRGGSTFSEVGFLITRRAREHRRMPEVLTFDHNSVEYPVVERCFTPL